MTTHAALRELFHQLAERVRDAEQRGDFESAERFERRRWWVSSLLGFRQTQEARRLNRAREREGFHHNHRDLF
jgi:hypothetical protein